MTDEPRRTRSTSSGQTRRDLLAAGADLLREQPVGPLLSNVTAPEVARRAGRTIGAFYHHWPDQGSYRRELAQYVLSPEVLPTEETAENLGAGIAAGADTAEVMRYNARANLLAGLERPELALTVALTALARTDEDVRLLLKSQHDTVRSGLEPLYEQLLAANGWRLRPPFTLRMFSAVLTALVEGLYVRAVADPESVPLALPDEHGTPPVEAGPPSPVDGQWDLFSIVVLALMPVMCMPADPAPEGTTDAAALGRSGVLATDADVRDLVRAIWRAWAERRRPE